MFKNALLLLFVAASLVMTSCEKEDPVIPNEEEVITTLNYTLTAVGDAGIVTFSFQDLDGDGAGAPTITGGDLVANTTYTGVLELLNETESPAEDITEEIEEEDDEHQFFFQSDIDGLSVAYNDEDEDGNPVGLSTTLTTADAGSGSLTIILRHEPLKSAANVSDGDITNADGETDIEVTFAVEVK
jgi:hypothetical protein